jgi:hypothetical protein
MAYRWLKLPVFGAFALTTLMAGPAFAQYGSPYDDQRPPYRDWGRGDYRGGSYGYDNGFRAGAREGQHDAVDGRAFGYKRDDVYEDADWGFRGGSKRAYRNEFRRGYEDGYEVAYRRNYRGEWRDGDRRWRDHRNWYDHRRDW